MWLLLTTTWVATYLAQDIPQTFHPMSTSTNATILVLNLETEAADLENDQIVVSLVKGDERESVRMQLEHKVSAIEACVVDRCSERVTVDKAARHY